MPSMNTKMNNNVQTQTIEKSKHIEYSDQTVKFNTRVIENLIKNTTEKGEIFAQRNFLHKVLKSLEKKGVMS